MSTRGLFVTLEGGEGAGKSTQAALLRVAPGVAGAARGAGARAGRDEVRRGAAGAAAVELEAGDADGDAAVHGGPLRGGRQGDQAGTGVRHRRDLRPLHRFDGGVSGLRARPRPSADRDRERRRDRGLRAGPDGAAGRRSRPRAWRARARTAAGDSIEGHWQAGLSLQALGEEKPARAAGGWAAGTGVSPTCARRATWRWRRQSRSAGWCWTAARRPEEIAGAIWGRVEAMLAREADGGEP